MLGWMNHRWNQDLQEKYQQPQICRWYHYNGRKWRGTREPLEEGERGQWKTWLKTQYSKNKDHGIWSHHFMADKGEKVERVTDIFLGTKITAHVYCSHEINRCLLLGRKAVTNLDSILKSRKKSRDITLLTQVHIVKAIVFPVVMYRCESWTMKKVEHQRIDACKLWCWKRLLRISWEIKPVHPKGYQPWIFIGRTDAEAEASILWPPDMKSRLTGKGIDAGKDWRQEEKGRQRMRQLDGITDSMHMSLSKLQEKVGDRRVCRAAVYGVTKSRPWLSDWTVTVLPETVCSPALSPRGGQPLTADALNWWSAVSMSVFPTIPLSTALCWPLPHVRVSSQLTACLDSELPLHSLWTLCLVD